MAAKNMENIYNLFQLPLSIVAHQQLHRLLDQLNDISEYNDSDKWNFNWGSNTHMTKKIYNFLMGHSGTADPKSGSGKHATFLGISSSVG